MSEEGFNCENDGKFILVLPGDAYVVCPVCYETYEIGA